MPVCFASTDTTTARLQRILAVHFDPHAGSPYWLQRERELRINVRREVRTIHDLHKLGAMDEAALTSRPIEHFLPREMRDRRAELIIGETAGTLGRPKLAAYHREEFDDAFVAPFVAAAQRIGFPRGANWLFIGPSGPHIIGKAARACAAAMDSADPFTIDLDPRWAKKLPRGSFAWTRYLTHIQEQALAILRVQTVGVIFATPVVLESLVPQLDDAQRQMIRGIHLGGLAVSAAQYRGFEQMFPNVVMLSGYGNTLFGMMPELHRSPRTGIDYFPLGERLLLRVVDESGRDAAPGERGRVVFTRLDRTQLIINLMERDSAMAVKPLPDAARQGFTRPGLRDPQPIINQDLRPALGLY